MARTPAITKNNPDYVTIFNKGYRAGQKLAAVKKNALQKSEAYGAGYRAGVRAAQNG